MSDQNLSEDQRQVLYDDHRRKIIASVFSKRNGAGGFDETYVAHLKIWDGGGPGAKPRYILLSQASSGSGYIHKSKLNQNDTFSVGKTWVLSELKGLSVINPSSFTITLQRSYQWDSAHAADQANFLEAIVKLFRVVVGGSAPLRLEGISESVALSPAEPTRQRVRNDSARSSTPTQLPVTTRRSQISRSNTPSRDVDNPAPRSRSRPPSPSRSHRASPSISRTAAPPVQQRPPSPPSQLQPQPRQTHARRPSNGTSARSSTPNISSQPPLPSTSSITSVSDLARASPSPQPPVVSRQAPKEPPPPPAIPPQPRPQKVTRTMTNMTQDGQRRDANARISFFDPANQAAIDRLLNTGINELEGEDDNAQATMASVEEMIEGYEWATDDVIGRKGMGGAADVIEARLLDELMALERANIHSFLEADDRITVLLKYMDEAIGELDSIGSSISSYKIHLNGVGNDISFIQSQNRGLQVQTQNQRTLLEELENLLQTVQVDKNVLLTLTQESMEKESAIGRIEEAAAELYKALQAGRETDMAATMERLAEYKTHNQQFCKRIFDYMSLRFTVQSQMLLGDYSGLAPSKASGRPVAIPHTELENYLARYTGLILYLKEMDESVYNKLSATYFTAASELHSTQMRALFSAYIDFVKRGTEDEQDGFSGTPTVGGMKSPGTIRRAATVIRSPLDRQNRERAKPDGDMRAPDALSMLLEQIASLIYAEDAFVTTFLQVNDASLTFADYMSLDSYFRRQASRTVGLSQATMKLVRSAMDLIFGFLPTEMKTWIDGALAKDNMQIFGVLVCIERFQLDAEDQGNDFLLNFLGKQHTRLKGLFDRHVSEQIQNVEKTKVTSKKRNGVAPFVKYFPSYIVRVETQLLGADGLEIRTNVDSAYERIVETMFESLKQMAKMDGEGEDKGQLNYHVILIENMHHFVAEMSQLEIGSVVSFLKKAEATYDENINAYVKIVLRRPFAKLIDYFEGVERLLQTTAPSEVASNSSYNKSALKKVVKDFNAKDIRKNVDSLFKRVEKHFNEVSDKANEDSGSMASGTVLSGVWRACEDELLRITELFSKRISRCYSDGGVGLDYTASDVESAFKRHRVGS